MTEDAGRVDGEPARIAERARKDLNLSTAKLADVYYYSSLSLCALDAVYSIGVRYESTEAVVKKYCEFYGLRRIRADRAGYSPRAAQEPLSRLVERISEHSAEGFATTVVRNRQRTSARGGVLKAEAVAAFAQVLTRHGVEYFDQVPAYDEGSALVSGLRAVRGQGSGISAGYFWMLAGSDDLIKPDRMILGFLKDTLSRDVSVSEACALLAAAAVILQAEWPHLTPRLLDYEVWLYQRRQGG